MQDKKLHVIVQDRTILGRPKYLVSHSLLK